MKKIIMITLLFVLIFCGVKANAQIGGYVNLLDMRLAAYDETQDVFYSSQKIKLTKNTCYTLVASSDFFGDATNKNAKALVDENMGTRFTTLEGKPLIFKLSLVYADTGFYHASVTPDKDCYLEFTDFLTKGYTIDTLPKNKIQFFLGEKTSFQGFRENEYLDDYEKVSDVISIYTGCLNPIKVEDITSKLKSFDNVDGSINSVVLVSDNYQNNNAVGEYELTYKCSDKSNNEKLLVVKIIVLDTEPPVITGPDIIEFDCYGDCPSPEEIIRKFTAYDEIDGYLNSKITVQSSGLVMYQMGKTKDYTLVLAVSDKSKNTTTKTITLRAKDMYAPTLEVRDVEIKLSEIGQSLFEDFFGQVVSNVSDNSNKYTIEYEAVESLGEFGFTGTYEVTVIVKDETSNTTTKKAYITIVDDIAPDFYMHTDLLSLTTNEVYTVEDIKEAISSELYEDGILFDSINLISCDYFSNEKTPGSYTVRFTYSYKGQTNYMVGSINVTEPEQPTYYWLLLLLIVPLISIVVFVNKKRQNSY